ncbi:Carboxylesterase 2 [Pseudovibrio axinellae]|uniref:Carboxylesterase 2 n=1 Tax=Pseudovibrio axinellae TaxID=989403 RepID=A0A166AZG8_9HYPH|nr:phospholipase [Pseudovibrio axinellae]KZL21748.1 Carboxylesterase 2 [Pseudovibrio axinellae]SEQ21881.1 phospholipase/carboxylesterase [Pseudovibrio axinellae]
MPHELESIRLEPSHAPVRKLLVLLHGYGGDAGDMEPTGRALRDGLPGTAVVCVNGPEPCAHWVEGRQWFAAMDFDAREIWHGVQAAAPLINRVLDAELEHYGLNNRDMVLGGFSQGAMVALHVGSRRFVEPAGLLSFSGILAGPSHLIEQMVVRPRVMLLQGSDDDVVNPTSMDVAESVLRSAGFDVEAHMIEGLEHSIDAKAEAFALRFLRWRFGMDTAAS